MSGSVFWWLSQFSLTLTISTSVVVLGKNCTHAPEGVYHFTDWQCSKNSI